MSLIFGANDRKRKAGEFSDEESQETKKQLLCDGEQEMAGEVNHDDIERLLQEESTENGQDPEGGLSAKQENATEEKEAGSDAEEEGGILPFVENAPGDFQQAAEVLNGNSKEHSTAADTETVVPFDRLIILNVSATCDENLTNPASVQVTKENSEIIELSFVVVDAKRMAVVHSERKYVKPERTPLTEYCTQVTGITWENLVDAGNLQDAINALDSYIQAEIEGKHSFCFVTHGGWTLRIQLPREARDKGIELPGYLAFCRMFDLKQEIQRWQVHHPDVSLRSTALKDLCETFHLERVTDQSAGQNACLTTANVIRYLTGFRHPDVFVHPIDTNADLQQFKKESSKVVHLAGLPYEVTQGELDAWFSSSGLRPTASWMIQTSDYTKRSLSGFIVFHSHNDAMRALALNGRCLGDRAIEVSPSSERVIEAAGSMLAPFPTQPKSRPLRPGDWNCPSCTFHNFASRRNCFKCNTENPNAALAPPPAPPHVPNFTPGDWICPNYNCSFHNYASRMQCMKCGTYRPANGSMGAPPAGPPPHAGFGRPHHNITFRPGDWYCPNPSCNFQNFASRSVCFRCHTSNPSSSRPYPDPQSGYGYSAEAGYGGVNNSYGNGGYGSVASPGYGSTANPGYGYGPQGGSHAQFRPGDWYCPSCNSHNFASRFQCLKCATSKPQSQPPHAGYMASGPGMRPN